MEILNKINSAVWGAPTLLLIFFTGVILSLRTNFFAICHLGRAAKLFFGGGKRESSQNRLTPLQSASTALSATPQRQKTVASGAKKAGSAFFM